MILKNCRYVVTQSESREILENVDIEIADNIIKKIGPNLGEGIDCSQRIVMPGLINAHSHLGMTHLRGISDDKELKDWLADVHDVESTFTDKDIEQGNHLGLAESIRNGTTTIVDTFFKEELAGKTAEKLGIRLFGANGLLKNHPLANNEITLSKNTELVTYCLGPHAIYTTDETILKKVREEATKENALIMIHISETRKERADCKNERGLLPIEYLDSLNFLGPDVLLVHCNWLTKGELDIIKKHDAKVVHCPQSNMKLAGGNCMPVKEMLERGITISLGTDSAVSNNSLDMFREMHTAALLHKHHYWSPTVTNAQQILDMATINSSITLNKDIGSIQTGKLADIITLDLNDLNLQPHEKNKVVSHIVYAANGLNVAEVIINGKLLVQNKVFL